MAPLRTAKRAQLPYSRCKANHEALLEAKIQMKEGCDELFNNIVAGIEKLAQQTGFPVSTVARSAFRTCKQEKHKCGINLKNAFVSIHMEELNKGMHSQTCFVVITFLTTLLIYKDLPEGQHITIKEFNQDYMPEYSHLSQKEKEEYGWRLQIA
jgi:hypothetical protein